MRNDEDSLTFGQMLAISIAPALVEHIAAPLIGREIERRDAAAKRKKRRPSGAEATTFAAYVERADCRRYAPAGGDGEAPTHNSEQKSTGPSRPRGGAA